MPDIRPTVGSGALVLNVTYEPLCVVSVRRAAILVLSGKAALVTDGDGILHSARDEIPVPSVIRLTRYVRVPYRTHVGLSRRAIFARDGWRCAYCRGPAQTIDHVFPRSRGGLHAWENVVAACAKCNHTKGDKTPAELGWRLHGGAPAAPKGQAWRVLGHRLPDPRWADWLDIPLPETAAAAA
ncbi:MULTISPECIES: HNH endonuclease [Catenuloplanes]|uniref:5-methylcytosine-specific restriction endonuclease McrA n=1 Tax=Catenuloplanes niger TaxID=587534 RepID=A0AAE3ZNM5_9ACTN|nr:HNH endonuclease [Catenuloplanes niger]MDR7322119.1 5-methylcytosine-specific restriction endonuclease McrA [Catenuloplanes niger]